MRVCGMMSGLVAILDQKLLKSTIFEIFYSEELLLHSAGYEHFKNRLIADGGKFCFALY